MSWDSLPIEERAMTFVSARQLERASGLPRHAAPACAIRGELPYRIGARGDPEYALEVAVQLAADPLRNPRLRALRRRREGRGTRGTPERTGR